MTKLLKPVFIIFAIASVMACSKGDNNESDNPGNSMQEEKLSYPETEEEALLYIHAGNSRTWKAAKFNLSMIGTQSCRLDDSMIFNVDGTYAYNNGKIVCGGDVAEKTGTWELDFLNRHLIFDKDSENEQLTEVMDLSEKSLQVTGSWSVYQVSAGYKSE